MKPDSVADNYLDDEEREIAMALEDALANGTYVSDLTPERLAELQEAARNTINPPKQQITTRIAKPDLAALKVKAMQKGIPYQTLLASIVHQYVEGRLIEKP